MLSTARRIYRHRALLLALTVRELKARYRGSVLGFLWSLVQPLLLLAVYSFVFGVAFVPARPVGTQPYALFLVCGLFPWIWVSSSLNEGVTSLQTHAGLIRKAVFPAELLPIVSVLSNGAHFLLALPILAVALAVGRGMGFRVGGWSAALLPVVLLLQLLLLAGLALGLAALYAHFRDIKDILANLLTLLFFLTPILYPLDSIGMPLVRRLIAANPFTPFALAYQSLLFAGTVPAPTIWIQMVLVAAVAWLVGGALFSRLRETLVEAV